MIYVRRVRKPGGLVEVVQARLPAERLGSYGFKTIIPKKSDFDLLYGVYHSYCVVRDGLDLELLDWCVPR